MLNAYDIARGYSLCFPPPDWDQFDRRRRTEIAALAICELKARATAGDGQAVHFFRGLYRENIPSPAPPPADKIRVGFLTPILDFPGGTEEWILSIVKHLGSSDRLQCSGVAVFSEKANKLEIERFSPLVPVIVGAGSVALLAAQSDVLVMWGMDNLPYWLPQPVCKTVLVIHGTARWSKWIAEKTGPLVDAVVGVSQASSALFPGAVTIENGVDLERCTPRSGKREAIRNAWAIQTGQSVLGFVGRIVAEKDPLAIAHAVRALPPGWVGVLCGKGEEQIVAEAHRIAPNKIIHHMPTARIGEVLAGLDCLMLCSDHEGFCLALVEAWAAGVPTVATAVGIVPEAEAEHGPLTVTVPHRSSPDVLAKAVQRAVSRDNADVVERARRIARSEYSAEKMGRAWEDYLLSLIGVDSR
jgi:glycosyltransferase involved in cell wall biosynthesis